VKFHVSASLYRSTETHVAQVVTDFVHFGVGNDILFFGFSLSFFPLLFGIILN
jgi:hypothetical protein